MIALTRPLNCFIAAFCVLSGAYIVESVLWHPPVILAMVSIWCLCAGANVLNDVCDVQIDRHNKSDRPLASGRVSERAAVGLAIAMYILGAGLSILLSPHHVLISGIIIVLTVLYNITLKRRLLIGNLVAAGAASLAFVYGGMLGPDVYYILIPTGFAFLFHFGREILKDMEDIPGDRAGHVVSAPIRLGVSSARLIITVTFLSLMVTTIWPYAAGWFGMRYLALVSLVDLILVYVLWSVWRDTSPDNAGRLSRILKANMVIGVMAVVLGR